MSRTYSTCPAKHSIGRAVLSTREEAAETIIYKDLKMPERNPYVVIQAFALSR
jgi:hypothetical protein